MGDWIERLIHVSHLHVCVLEYEYMCDKYIYFYVCVYVCIYVFM